MKAEEEYKRRNVNQAEGAGVFTGTSNVHFAHRYSTIFSRNGSLVKLYIFRFNLNPIGTVAHEWFMGIAAITQDYLTANLVGLEKWVSCFGTGVLGIALTDTFGTEQFLKCFKTERPGTGLTYADIFTGVRQDSGDPEDFVRMMKSFYQKLEKETGRKASRKTIVFSDSLNVDLCLKYKECAEENGFATSFGIGTYLTSLISLLFTVWCLSDCLPFVDDFSQASDPNKKSTPLNIVIKVSSAAGYPAVKISDNLSKNTGDQTTVEEVKRKLGYVEKAWLNEDNSATMGDETNRW